MFLLNIFLCNDDDYFNDHGGDIESNLEIHKLVNVKKINS